MLDLGALCDALDLWGCMWEPAERERFETAVVRSMTDEHPHELRRRALTLCHVLGTPRLLAAAERVAESGVFSDDEIDDIEIETLPLFRLLEAAQRMSGNFLAVEVLLAR